VTVQVNIEKSLRKSANAIDERGWMRLLTPAHDITPDACKGAFKPDKPKPIVIILGSAVATPCAEETCNIITAEGNGKISDLLVVHRVKTGPLVDAKIFDPDGNIVASIVSDKPHINRNYVSDWNRADEHTLLVIDNHDKRVLYLRFVNETTLYVEGTFNLPKELQGPTSPHNYAEITQTEARFSPSVTMSGGSCVDTNGYVSNLFEFGDSK
jgi:hypothetical protein